MKDTLKRTIELKSDFDIFNFYYYLEIASVELFKQIERKNIKRDRKHEIKRAVTCIEDVLCALDETLYEGEDLEGGENFSPTHDS